MKPRPSASAGPEDGLAGDSSGCGEGGEWERVL